MKKWNFRKTFAIALALLLQLSTAQANTTASPVNFWGSYSLVKVAKEDITKPVAAGRAYFTTSVEETKDGAKLIVEIYHGALNSPVSLWLQAAVNDGKGNVEAIPFMQLDDKVADNAKNYYSRREFNLTYNDLNTEFQKLLPKGAKHLNIGPGTPLFLYGEFHQWGHQWGGIGRGGIFFMPEKLGAAQTANTAMNLRRPTELDLAYPITEIMGLAYNNLNSKSLSGLKVGGQIRSRMESEGKYQIPVAEMARIRKELFDIANDPVLAEKIFGKDWTIQPEMRYMRKNAKGELLLDKFGLPRPDPMVDTYYDSAKFDAAKNDMAIRYRWTEGNATGSWNFKPGLTHASKDGIVERLEYAVDTTNDKPSTIKKFADSMDPLNPFRMIREVIPGSTPSDFLKPAVKITDTRYKFKLTHKSGLVIEVSLDYVHAESLRNGKTARFGQMEMDIDHPATSSKNVAGTNGAFTGLSGIIGGNQAFLKSLHNDAFLDGRPVIHSAADLDAKSPLKVAISSDLKTATKAITALRDAVIGNAWIPGAQKNAYASYALGLVSEKQASNSVKATLAAIQSAAQPTKPTARRGGIANCGPAAFN